MRCGDSVHLADINECSTNTHNCSSLASCADTDGGFTCTCNAGLIGDGFQCRGE